ncbi:MAG TPA: hypothetical protein VGQ83_12605 [Polyangia bacterium]
MRLALALALLLLASACAARPPGLPRPGTPGAPPVTALHARFHASLSGGCSRTSFMGGREGEVVLHLTAAGARLEQRARSRVTLWSGGFTATPTRKEVQDWTVTARWEGSWRVARGAVTVDFAPARTRCQGTHPWLCDAAPKLRRLECRWTKAKVAHGGAERPEELLRCVADQKPPVSLGAEDGRPVVWLSPRPGLELQTAELGLYPMPLPPTLRRAAPPASAPAR